MKISTESKGNSESYAVNFWYKNEHGYLRQSIKLFYCNSKSAHKQVEVYAKKSLAKIYKDISIISVVYQ